MEGGSDETTPMDTVAGDDSTPTVVVSSTPDTQQRLAAPVNLGPLIREQGPSGPASPTSPRQRKPSPLTPEALRRIHLMTSSEYLPPPMYTQQHLTVGGVRVVSPASPNYPTSDLGSSPRSSISVPRMGWGCPRKSVLAAQASTSTTYSSGGGGAAHAFRSGKTSSSDYTDADSDLCKDLLSPGIMLSPAPYSPFADPSSPSAHLVSPTAHISPSHLSPVHAMHQPRLPISPAPHLHHHLAGYRGGSLGAPGGPARHLLSGSSSGSSSMLLGVPGGRSQAAGLHFSFDTVYAGGRPSVSSLESNTGSQMFSPSSVCTPGANQPALGTGLVKTQRSQSDSEMAAMHHEKLAKTDSLGARAPQFKKRLLQKYEAEQLGRRKSCRAAEVAVHEALSTMSSDSSSGMCQRSHTQPQSLLRLPTAINRTASSPPGQQVASHGEVQRQQAAMAALAAGGKDPFKAAVAGALTPQGHFDVWVQRQLLAWHSVWYARSAPSLVQQHHMQQQQQRDTSPPVCASEGAATPRQHRKTTAPAPVQPHGHIVPPFGHSSRLGSGAPGPLRVMGWRRSKSESDASSTSTSCAPLLATGGGSAVCDDCGQLRQPGRRHLCAALGYRPASALGGRSASPMRPPSSHDTLPCTSSAPYPQAPVTHALYPSSSSSGGGPLQQQVPLTCGRPHRCSVCHKSFGRSDMLSRHMRLHTGTKPYACRMCGQEFSRSDHLNTHQRTHTGEKPYQCPQCPYAASRRDMITRHMRTHTRAPAPAGGGGYEAPGPPPRQHPERPVPRVEVPPPAALQPGRLHLVGPQLGDGSGGTSARRKPLASIPSTETPPSPNGGGHTPGDVHMRRLTGSMSNINMGGEQEEKGTDG